jgi:hypothetical protein
MGRICDICNTDLGEQTDYNFNRHRNSNQCQANQNRKKLIKDSSQSTHSPSTNRPIECPHCKLVLWSYNLQCHYSERHQTSIAPDIDPQEIIRIQNYKK